MEQKEKNDTDAEPGELPRVTIFQIIRTLLIFILLGSVDFVTDFLIFKTILKAHSKGVISVGCAFINFVLAILSVMWSVFWFILMITCHKCCIKYREDNYSNQYDFSNFKYGHHPIVFIWIVIMSLLKSLFRLLTCNNNCQENINYDESIYSRNPMNTLRKLANFHCNANHTVSSALNGMLEDALQLRITLECIEWNLTLNDIESFKIYIASISLLVVLVKALFHSLKFVYSNCCTCVKKTDEDSDKCCPKGCCRESVKFICVWIGLGIAAFLIVSTLCASWDKDRTTIIDASP